MSINPTRESLEALQARAGDDRPIAMINLLRYREHAEYPKDTEAKPCSGYEAYQRYAAVAIRKIRSLGGRVLWMGNVAHTVIAPQGEQWDEALIVEYPSARAFLEMLAMEDYQAAAVHRTAALADARLIMARPGEGGT